MIGCRLKKIEKLERSENSDLGLRFIKNKKQVIVSSNDLTKKSPVRKSLVLSTEPVAIKLERRDQRHPQLQAKGEIASQIIFKFWILG